MIPPPMCKRWMAGVEVTDVLNVRVTDTDGADSDVSTVTVTITGVNDDPVIAEGDTLDDGLLSVDVNEGTTAVVTLTATDIDAGDTGFTYSLSGGDSNDFNIGASTGVAYFQNCAHL